jgi:membrane fusion protein, multidrug efflux system
MRWFYRLCVVSLGCALFFVCGCQKGPAVPTKAAAAAGSAQEAVPVKVAVVTGQTIQELLDYVADIKAQEEVMVYPKVTGKVIEKTKDEGAVVAKNEAVMLLDRDEVGQTFALAPVESPIAGMVGKVYVDIGAHVSPQSPVAMVIDMNKVKVYLDIPEKYIPVVSVDMHASVTVDAYPGQVFDGIIAQISPVIDTLTRTAQAQIVIDNQDHRLRSGMFAKVKVVTAEYADSLVVLKEAVMGKEPQQYVYVVEDGTARLREIKTGVRQGAYVQVIKGLAKGDKVVIMGQQRLFEGAVVLVEEERQ